MNNNLKFDRHELSGAFADLGIFIPIAVALITLNGLSASPVFLAAGCLYVVAGLYYRVPMPVQPLKAAAVIAIATACSPAVISATALSMGVVLLVLRLFDLNRIMARLFPKVIIRGIQLSVGLMLIKKGVMLFIDNQLLLGGGDLLFKIVMFSVPMGMVIGLVAFLIIIIFRKSKRVPAGLVLVSFGLIVGLIVGRRGALDQISLGWDFASLALPAYADFLVAVPILLLPQLPLTFANSIIATEDTARQYFDDGARRVTIRALMTTIGAANIIAGLIGGMPMCHGSGGLTAHYKFGARSGGSSVIIGAIFIIIALMFGRSATAIFSLIPLSVFGVMLIYIGLMHAFLIKDIVKSPHDLMLVIAMAAITVTGGGLAIAFVLATIFHVLFMRIKQNNNLPG